MEQGKPFSEMESPLVDFDAVCQKVRAAVEPARAHAVSLHDENGDVLWLSESSMGPDEHNAVLEAIETFSNPKAPPILAYDLGDARSAVLLRAISARRAMVGAIMIVLDSRVIRHDEHGAIKFMNPKLQRVLMDFAGMRPDIEPPPEVQIAPEPPPAAKAPLPPLRRPQGSCQGHNPGPQAAARRAARPLRAGKQGCLDSAHVVPPRVRQAPRAPPAMRRQWPHPRRARRPPAPPRRVRAAPAASKNPAPSRRCRRAEPG